MPVVNCSGLGSEAIFNGWKQIGEIEVSKIPVKEKLVKLAGIPTTLQINQYYYDLLGCLQLNYDSQILYIELFNADQKSILQKNTELQMVSH